MKNLLNKLDELEDGSFGRRIGKTEQEWFLRRYRHNPYRRIKPISAAAMVGKHVNSLQKYLSLMPPRYGKNINDLLSYLNIAIKAKDGAYIDGRGWRGRYSTQLKNIEFHIDDQGIIRNNPLYTRWRGVRDTRPKYIVARDQAQRRAKKRKEDREKKLAKRIELEKLVSRIHIERRRKAAALEAQKIQQHGFDPKLAFRNHEIRKNKVS
jgi:hypothetical protein